MHKIDKDNRHFPRLTRLVEGDVLFGNRLQRVVTRDVSASGLRFAATEPVIPPALFLAHIDDDSIQRLQGAHKMWLNIGNDFLARAVWVKKIPGQSLYEMGARFVARSECSGEEIEEFTSLINKRILKV